MVPKSHREGRDARAPRPHEHRRAAFLSGTVNNSAAAPRRRRRRRRPPPSRPPRGRRLAVRLDVQLHAGLGVERASHWRAAAASAGTISSRAGGDEKSPERAPPGNSGGGHATSADKTAVAGTGGALFSFSETSSSADAVSNAASRDAPALSPKPGRSFPVTNTGTFTDAPPAAVAAGARGAPPARRARKSDRGYARARRAPSNEPRVFRSHERGVAEEREDAAYALKRERETRRGGPGPTALDPTCFGADGDGARGGRNVAGGGRNVQSPASSDDGAEERAVVFGASVGCVFVTASHLHGHALGEPGAHPKERRAAGSGSGSGSGSRGPRRRETRKPRLARRRRPRAATRVAPNAHPTDDRTSAKSPSVTRRCFGDSSIDRVGGYAFVSV